MNLKNMFRGVDIETGELVFGTLSKDPMESINRNAKGLIEFELSDAYFLDGEYFIEVHKTSIAMNTGLKDTNGKDIYGSFEIDRDMTRGGDVTKLDGLENYPVFAEFRYNYDLSQVDLVTWFENGTRDTQDRDYLECDLMTTGNAYQNQELLK